MTWDAPSRGGAFFVSSFEHSSFGFDSSFEFRHSDFPLQRPRLNWLDPMLPLVLHKGLFGFGDLNVGPLKMTYFHKIDQALAARGHPLILPQVHPTGGIA